MIVSLLAEQHSLWERLQKETRPIYLYGMGDGAEKVLRALSRYGITPAGVYASDEFVRGHSFAGYPVETRAAVAARGPFVGLMCFATEREPYLSRCYQYGEEDDFFAPDVPVVPTDDTLFDLDYVKKHEDALDLLYRSLGDELSRQTLINLLSFKVSGRIPYLKEIATPIEEGYRNLFCPHGEGTYVDLGAFNGDTARDFARYGGRESRMLLLEPDPKNFKRLCKTVEAEGLNARCVQAAAYSRSETLWFKGGKGGRNGAVSNAGAVPVQGETVDRLLGGQPAHWIKFDVEGAEAEALAGCAETIRQWRPNLMVAAYHKNEDLVTLPAQILSLCPDYRLYLRQKPYIPAWEINLFARVEK